LARAHTESALRTLAAIMNKENAPESARVSAAQALLDRGWGKAVQFVEQETTVRYVARLPEKATNTQAWQKQHAPEQTAH
jgi:hypothetical protein